MREAKDRSGQWLLEHHGDAFLRLAGVTGFTSCRPVRNVVAYPKLLPDGLHDVRFPGPEGSEEEALFLVEIETYPDRETHEQILRDMALVFLNAGVVPDVVCVVLAPRGQGRITGTHQLDSRRGLAGLGCRFHVVELWSVEAEAVLAGGEVGALPLVPLMRFDGEAAPMLERCRQRIFDLAAPDERDNLLAITATMAMFRYNDRGLLLSLLRGAPMIMEIPYFRKLFQEDRCERDRRSIQSILQQRFGGVPETLAARLRLIDDDEIMGRLVVEAAVQPSLASFEEALPS